MHSPRLCGGILTFLGLALSTIAAPLPTVDLSGDELRQVVVAQGTPEVYQGHPTTVLLPDGKTMYCVWTLGHGGTAGPMKRSDDGGRTWSELLRTPENWTAVRNCPSIYRLSDPVGATRLFVFAGRGADGNMQESHSADEGKTWTPMKGIGLAGVMPFCTIVPVEGGKKLLGLTNIRRPGETKDKTSNVIAQSTSTDGGRTWKPWRIVLDLGELKPCEPAVVRSPDGKQLLCLMRENLKHVALFMTSDDEGQTWSESKPLPEGLHGDRHMPRYAADGRLVVCFRDTGRASETKTHFMAWVGRYEDIVAGRDGAYRIKLLHSYAGGDCGYPGLELLPDGNFVATTYIKYREGAEKNSVVSTRFQLEQTDKVANSMKRLMQLNYFAKVGTEKAANATPAEPARKPPGVAGILMDDGEAEYAGDWVESAKQQPLVGAAYRHDNRQTKGDMTAKFTPEIPRDGKYEVRLLYVATSNRATNVPVTIRSAEGEKTVTVNQKLECLENGVPRALGVFEFKAGKLGSVVVSNAKADGFVVVDGVQFVPADIAQGERATHADAGFPTGRSAGGAVAKEQKPEVGLHAMATAVAVSPLAKKTAPNTGNGSKSNEAVQLAKDTPASEVDGKSYDLVVVGGTAGGVMCAVRAAREGLSVLLVQHNEHLGGMMSNGLMQWDALYGGPRAPLFTELLRNIEKDAISRFGENSRDHQTIRYTHEHYPMGWAEPHVMEREVNRLVAGEKKITVLLSHYPTAVEREGALLRSVTLRGYGSTKDIRVTGTVFADGTYEGDLFAVAKVPYRVGREARAEYGEPHAGKVFCNIDKGPAPRDAAEGRLNIRAYGSKQGSVDPTSPFTADGAVQAYNYRFCVTRNPENRVMVTAPPPGYTREEYVNYERKSIGGGGPNMKAHMNSPILPGENHAYPEGDWATREKIIERHKNFALGLIWFLQNDESVPEEKKKDFRQWGLPKDEFEDHGHIPYEMYVREARRIVGRHVLTELDGSLAKGFGRTPIFADSIAVTDWYMDSHSCTMESRPGFRYDGKLILTEESRPGQIPYRALLPQGVDNLLVPVGLGSTHIAWGAIRLEPVWMQTGEAAGWAAALAVKGTVTAAGLDPDLVVRTLVENGQLVSFFNEIKVDAAETGIAAAQYFGTKGFFADYNARLGEGLKGATGKVWVEAFQGLKKGGYDPNAVARRIAESETGDEMTVGEFLKLVPGTKVGGDANGVIARGKALEAMYSVLGK